MDWSQSLNAPPYFDGSNYAVWKVRMRAFLCSIDEAVGMLLKLVGQSLRQPNPLGIRQPLQHQTLIAKHLTQFFMVCPQMSSIGFLISPLQGSMADFGDHL